MSAFSPRGNEKGNKEWKKGWKRAIRSQVKKTIRSKGVKEISGAEEKRIRQGHKN